MAESDLHVDVTMYCKQALLAWFKDRPDVYVAADNFFYFEKGVRRSVVSPDCYVAPGAGMRQRRKYLLWEEGGLTPSVVFEITSESTRTTDLGKKKRIYEQTLKVPEYFLIDPTADYIPGGLRGFRLLEGAYQLIDPDSTGLWSQELALYLVNTTDGFRFLDPDTGRTLPTKDEETRDRQLAQTRAEAAEAMLQEEARERRAAEGKLLEEARERRAAEVRAEEAEAQMARMKAELEALRKRG